MWCSHAHILQQQNNNKGLWCSDAHFLQHNSINVWYVVSHVHFLQPTEWHTCDIWCSHVHSLQHNDRFAECGVHMFASCNQQHNLWYVVFSRRSLLCGQGTPAIATIGAPHAADHPSFVLPPIEMKGGFNMECGVLMFTSYNKNMINMWNVVSCAFLTTNT